MAFNKGWSLLFMLLAAAALTTAQEDAAGFDDVTGGSDEEVDIPRQRQQSKPTGAVDAHVPNTWSKKAEMYAPSARLAHAAASVQDRYVYIFGGTYGSVPLSIPYKVFNDLWMYDEPSDRWAEVTQRGDVPPARLHASMVASSDDTLLLFGGFNVFQGQPGHTGLNDLYEFRISTGVWTRLDTLISGPAPTIRGAHGYEFHNGAMYIFGGFASIGATGHLKELWRYQPASRSWTLLTSSKSFGPEGRIGVAFEAVGPDTLLLTTGGCSKEDDADGQCDVLWTYSPATDRWTQRPSTPAGFFQRRATGAASAIDGTLFQYGGFYFDGKTQPQIFGDLYALNTATWEWTNLTGDEQSKKPSPAFGHSFSRVGKRIVMFGGRTNSPAHPGSAETWEYTTPLEHHTAAQG